MTSAAGATPPGARRPATAVRDRAVTGLLVAVLAVAAFVVALPRITGPGAVGSTPPDGSGPAPSAAPAVYREGVVGKPASITPVTAKTRADRLLVGLLFSGLVKMGPEGTLVPDLASSWTVDKAGQVWTVSIRPDATWQDGQPVTADDVVYTVSALKDPSAAGGLAATWADVAVARLDDKTVEFTLGAPVSGFLAALTQPLLPSHLLTGVPMASLATSEYATSPVGSGPFQLAQLDDTHAVLVPAQAAATGGPSTAPGGTDGSGPSGPDSSPSPAALSSAPLGTATAPPSASAARTGSSAPDASGGASGSPSASGSPADNSEPALTDATTAPAIAADPNARPVDRIEIWFYDTEASLASAFTAGQIDGAAGLAPATTATLGGATGASVVSYPTTTLSAVLLNLRTTHPELRDANARKGLLSAIDRNAIATTALGGAARAADTLVPPESWAYDASAVAPLPYNPSAAASLLKKAGWTKKSGAWYAPKAKTPYTMELLTVPADVNPRLAAVAASVQAAWTSLGMKVTVTPLAGADLATRLKSGDFTAAVLDVASGLEPDLYPLLDSTQIRANGSNRSGFQDPAMDQLLEAARQPGTPDQRKAAWSKLLAGISASMPVLPIVWANEQMVSRGLSGETPRLIVHTGDRFWDVLAWRLLASR